MRKLRRSSSGLVSYSYTEKRTGSLQMKTEDSCVPMTSVILSSSGVAYFSASQFLRSARWSLSLAQEWGIRKSRSGFYTCFIYSLLGGRSSQTPNVFFYLQIKSLHSSTRLLIGFSPLYGDVAWQAWRLGSFHCVCKVHVKPHLGLDPWLLP